MHGDNFEFQKPEVRRTSWNSDVEAHTLQILSNSRDLEMHLQEN